MVVEGYKVFNSDWTCRDKQYSCPGYFEEDVVPQVCVKGMHFTTDIEYYFRFYGFKENIHIAKVIAVGDIAKSYPAIHCTNKIFIVEEIPLETIMEKLNPGGKTNIGYANIGERNRGNNNIGDNNRGNNNIGDNNRGDYNGGNDNNGYYNTGSLNLGSYNSGNCNNGYNNTGDYNIGDNNTGSYNKISYSTGFFNTEEQPIYMFNKPTKVKPSTIFSLDGMGLVYQLMTYYDRGFHYNKNPIDLSYYKKLCNKTWHCCLTDKQKEAVLSLPNFDAGIFKEITGIDVDMEVQDVWNLI